MDSAKPKVSIEYKDDATVAKLVDERILEDIDIVALENTLMPLVEDSDGLKLLIDFSNVQFLTSAVLGLLIRVSKNVYEKEGQLKLCSINSKILKIFKVTRLDKIFDIYDDQQSALSGFQV